jgi:hypothetical protein
MSYDQKTMYELLPAIYRIRDAEQGEPLHQLIKVLSEQVQVLEENLAQLYDDQFAETAAGWALPYLADLVGITGLGTSSSLSSRAEVAHTIGYRRRKGTAAMLEQLARDVTGWPARAVEFFELIAATQFMNHIRLENESFIDIRNAGRLEDLGTAFEQAPLPDAANLTPGANLTHTVDVRRIARGHGRYNIPNVGLFLWRLLPMSLQRSPAVPAAPGDKQRFLFSPLGIDVPLFTEPETETTTTHLAEPINVPDRIRRRVLLRRFADYYGPGRSIVLERPAANPNDDPKLIEAKDVIVCDLTGWTNLPSSKIAIDPVLGRIAFPANEDPPPLVTFHHGFSANMGGGEYSRVRGADPRKLGITKVTTTIAAALASLGAAGGTVEVPTSGRYVETLNIDATNRFIELRAGDKRRPAVELQGTLTITGGENDEVVLDGLLFLGGAVQVSGNLGRLRLRHCTFVPGITLNADGTPAQPAVPSLVIQSANTRVEIDRCITGGIRAGDSAEVRIQDSIVDATGDQRLAYGGTGTKKYGSPLRIVDSTVIGIARTSILRLASNTIFLGTAEAERRQEGCARFSYLAPGSLVPPRYHCQPESDDSLIRPDFTSIHFRDPGYCQLSAFCPREIAAGADDESAMGAFHDLFEPQREARLRARIEEYLRFGLEAGVFFAS